MLFKGDDALNKTEIINQIRPTETYFEPLDKPRSTINIIKSFIKGPCLNVYRNSSQSFKQTIIKMAEEYELLLIDHYEMFQYVPINYKGQIVLHTHNAEFMLWKRMSELTNTNPIKKLLLKWEAKRVERYERKIFAKSNLVYATPSDIDLYKKHHFEVNKLAITYHLGNDHLLNLPDLEFDQTEKVITFMGTLSWEPNIDGLVWFIEEVWPIISEKHTDCKLWILGKDPDSRLLNASFNDERIEFKGFVSDFDNYLRKTRVYIAPLRFGSGMKVKVLDGLYRGVPTVTTSVGAEGLSLNSGKEILIANDARNYAQDCIKLIEDQNVWSLLAKKSRQKAQEEYRWTSLFEKMDNALKEFF